jgi:hypothetical protein
MQVSLGGVLRKDPRPASCRRSQPAHRFTQTRLLPPGRLARLALVFLPIQSLTNAMYTWKKNASKWTSPTVIKSQ